MTPERVAWDDAGVQRLIAARQAELRAPATRAGARPARLRRRRQQGWTTLRPETGPRQPEAIALYTGAGYRQIGASGGYGDDPAAADSLFFERVLGG